MSWAEEGPLRLPRDFKSVNLSCSILVNQVQLHERQGLCSIDTFVANIRMGTLKVWQEEDGAIYSPVFVFSPGFNINELYQETGC